MNIIQIITELNPAGAERVVANLSIALKKEGHNVAIISLQPLPENSIIIDELLKNNIPIKSLNLTKLTPWRIFTLKNLIKSLTPNPRSEFRSQKSEVRSPRSEIRLARRSLGEGENPKSQIINHKSKIINHKSILLHSHLIHANLVCRINNMFGTRYKLINTIHIAEKRKSKKWYTGGIQAFKNHCVPSKAKQNDQASPRLRPTREFSKTGLFSIYFLLDRLTLNFCDCLTAVSKAAANFHAEMLHIPEELIEVVYNGIKKPKPLKPDETERLKDKWDIADCNKIIGSVGRLNWQKGYDQLLSLLPELSKKIPKKEKWGIVILGEGPERNKLEKLANNLPDNIKLSLPGFEPNAASSISAFDLFVMPSRYEGFGLTLTEAIAQGVPILCSNVDSLPEIIKDYRNGKTTNFINTTCINEILLHINKNKIKPTNPFPIKNMLNNYLKVYNNLN